MKNNSDLRFINTEKSIIAVFLELMSDIGYSKINVQKITDAAKINRSTFYYHFENKEELLEKVEYDLLDEFEQIIRYAPIDATHSSRLYQKAFMSHLNEIYSFLHKKGKIFTLLMSEKGDPIFVNLLSGKIKSEWNRKILIDKLVIPQKYFFASIIGITIGLIEEWVKGDFEESPETMVIITEKIINGIPQQIFD